MVKKELIQLKNVSKSFPGVKALNNVQLKLKEGSVHALVGENGAGKSTLIKILAGVHQPDQGSQIFLHGKEVVFHSPSQAMNNGISVIYQDISLFPNLSVAENIAIGNAKVWGHKLDWKSIKSNAMSALEKVGAHIDIESKLGDLSIASQQIVAIARAVTFQSKLVIMDEPTSSLTRVEINQLYDIIDNLKEDGVAVLFISHKLDEVFRVADDITVLRDGEYIATKTAKEFNEQELIRLMVGRDVQYLSLKAKKINDLLLDVKSLTKQGYFHDISFQLRQGEILGITGLVGSGRTELAKALFGIHKWQSGEVRLDGKFLKIRDSKEAIKQGIAYVPEDRHGEGLVLEEPIFKNIVMPKVEEFSNRLRLLKYKDMVLEAKNQIKNLDIRPTNEKMLAGQLSGGNQQKVVIAKWILSNPRLLIVDEPTNGVDIGAKIEIHKQLRKLADEGIGVIVISSELPEILALSDRVMVMSSGRCTGIVENKDLEQADLLNLALDTQCMPEGSVG